MLENIVAGIADTLSAAGYQAGRIYPRAPVCRQGLYLRLGLARAEQSEAGFARFLGLSSDGDGGEVREIYGMDVRLELRLDIYAGLESENAAADCEAAVDGIMSVLAQQGGLSISSVSCGEAAPDGDTGLFRCRCNIRAKAELCFEKSEDGGLFTDFILKGEIRK